MDFTDLGPAMATSDMRTRLDRIEAKSGLSIKTDLHHIPTDKLEKLAEKYQRRALISPNDQGLMFRLRFVVNEIGHRQLMADIEKDLAVK